MVPFFNHIVLQILNAFDLNPVYSHRSLNASGQEQKPLSTTQQQGALTPSTAASVNKNRQVPFQAPLVAVI